MEDYLLVTTDNAAETDMIQELLKKNGIRSYAQTDNTSEGLQVLFQGSAPFGNNIYVTPQDFEAAKQLVDAFFENKTEADSAE